MSTRKKIVLALGSLCLAVVLALAAVIAVLATANLTVNSQIGATYTAKDVNVVVGGEYALKGDAFTSMGESITFQTSESLQTKKLGLSGVRLTKEKPFVVLKYSFKNLSTENNVGISTTVTQGSDSNNVTVNVAYSKTAISPTLYTAIVGQSLSDTVLGGGETAYVYVKISVADPKQPAAFQGSIKFDLTRSSGDSTADQGLLKVGIGEVATYGEYPQTFVGAALNEILVAEYEKILEDSESALNPTGVVYYINNGGADDYRCPEYIYEGQKYALIGKAFFADTCTCILSTGESSDNYDRSSMFFKVEPIEFRLMEYDGENTVTLFSEYILGSMQFNTEDSGNAWAGCALETYLNYKFLMDSKLDYISNDPQQELALETTLQNNISGDPNDGSGLESTDKIWLPSFNDLQKWYQEDGIEPDAASPFSYLAKKATDFALASGAWADEYNSSYTSVYWLRSAGSFGKTYIMGNFGNIYEYYYTAYGVGYCPALKISLDRL